MTDLKTLKDIEQFLLLEGGDGVIPIVESETLRQEAIKWIQNKDSSVFYSEDVANVAIVEWIKHFFNITEEDLRDGEGDGHKRSKNVAE